MMKMLILIYKILILFLPLQLISLLFFLKHLAFYYHIFQILNF